jgi:septal ring factor EnvC (AmiA/AmiB activator)
MNTVSKLPPQPSRTAKNIAQIEAEIQQNQYQIEQLHHRNSQLRAHLNSLQTDRPRSSKSRSPVNSRRSTPTATKSRQRKSKQRPHQWSPKIFLIALAIAIVCGCLGFAIASLITGR